MTQLTGILLIWGAVITYAASNSIIALLTAVGESNPIDGKNPISFCNILFVGNLVALPVLLVLFGRSWTRRNIAALGLGDWIGLTLSAGLASAVAPGLYFYAIEHTAVTNVVLVGRVEPVLILGLSTLLLGERLNRWAFAGALIAVAGAAVVVLRGSEGARFGLGGGELAALGASLSFTVSTIFSRLYLRHIPFGVFMIYRTILGTAFFVVAGLYIFGLDHFQHMFAPIVWQYVVVYGVVIAVGGTLLWNLGLKYGRSGDISLATSFSPVAGVFFAIVLVDEPVTTELLAGGAVVVAGIIIGQFGERIADEARIRLRTAPSDAECLEYESHCNFKGV
ncbi:MAG: DMT family transporter [Anaerolineales bacterium]|nr:DMT family transporter [Anaerolineales bacterium]